MNHVHALLALCASAAAALAQSVPCFEPNFGTNLALGDDAVAYAQALGFAFPGPGGQTYTDVDVSSNGFVWLGTNQTHFSDCCSGDEQGFLSNDPRIAALWMDLYPPGAAATGGVFFQAIPAGPGGPARAVITWADVPEYGSPGALFTTQITLVSNGEILIHHAATNAQPQSFHAPLVGVTQGLGATANRVPFASLPSSGRNTATNPTAYQWYNYPPAYDLAGYTMWLVPNGSGGYVTLPVCSPPAVANYQTYGKGCPNPPTVYELFPFGTPVDLSNQSIQFQPNGQGGWAVLQGSGQFFTGYSNNLGLGDDMVAPSVALPWPYTTPAGTVTSIDVSSNGFVWLASNMNSRCCNGDVASFLADPASIAVLWQDLYPPGAVGGGVFADADPSGQAFYVTWANVPEYFNQGSNTCQLALFPNGGFELRYQTVGNLSHDVLVGFTTGNGTLDPGSRDLTAAIPFSTGQGGLPLTLDASAGTRPQLGTTFVQDITNVANGTVGAFMVFGFTNLGPAGFPLDPLGLPGCFQWTSIDASGFFAATAPAATFSLVIPNVPSLAGTVFGCQAATLTPGINAASAVTSNGAELTLGS